MAELTELLAPGQRIFVAGSSNEPTGLLEAMAHMQLPKDLHFLQFPIAGLNGVDFTAWNDSADLNDFFYDPNPGQGGCPTGALSAHANARSLSTI